MATKYTDEFWHDAVRMAISSGLTRPQVSSDLGGLRDMNGPLFAGDPEERMLGYGKEQMWKQIFT
jgi:transposase